MLAVVGWLWSDLGELREQHRTEIALAKADHLLLKSSVDVLAAEKLRNERLIAENQAAVTALATGATGDRYLGSWADRDFKLVYERITSLELRLQKVEQKQEQVK